MGTPRDGASRALPRNRVASETCARSTPLDGPLFRTLFAAALSLLERHATALNAINVFPVPDGDTGANMVLTLRSGVEEMSRSGSEDVGDAAGALAHGTLMGARGNSGVILSQILRGFSTAFEGRRDADGAALASALSAGAEAALGALSEPVEGTILTVVREAAVAVAEDPPEAVEQALDRASAAAFQAVERTPELLPALKEAGVVDAGGLGLAVILEGLRRSLTGESLDVDLAPDASLEASGRGKAVSIHKAEHGESGYCTEFVVSGERLDQAEVRARLTSLGTSVLVVGDGELVRVHLHTSQPDDALAYGRSLGQLTHTKVDNLEAQIQQFAAPGPPQPVTRAVDVVAVAAGDGIEAAFRSVGVTHLVRGGQTMNPSAGEILEEIEACAAEQVVVLPNNKNVIAAAEHAVEQSSKGGAVVPSRSIPHGIAAVLALNPDLTFDASIEAMGRAMASVKSAEVTRAVRETVADGQRVRMGQVIGLIDGALRVVSDNLEEGLRGCIDEMMSPEASLLTLYFGGGVREEDAGALADSLRDRYPGLEVELIPGGQPHYPYLLSLE